MSLEQNIQALTKAVIDLTEAMGQGAASAVEEEESEPEPAPKKRGRPAKKTEKITLNQLRNALRRVQTEVDKATAKGVLEEFSVTKLADLEEGDYAEFLDVCRDALEGEEEDED